uniref:Variant surface glycoprotein 813 n=1 Tax=Trypanosoma brucei TaxID=5691 RepID=M4T0S4_9TRYP|nr:variant surface glycoprotein 813 [Trypanosoma brucei]
MIYKFILALIGLCGTIYSAKNDNGAEFRVLCDILALKDSVSSIAVTTENSTADAVVSDLTMLNISTATDSYIQHKDGELTEAKAGEKKAEITAWKATLAKLDKPEGTPPTVKYQRLKNNNVRTPANENIKTLLGKATELAEQYRTTNKEAEETTAEAKTLITNALFGQDKTEFDANGLDSSTVGNNCGTTIGHADVGKCVAYDLLCLCVPQDAQDNDGTCQDGLTPTHVVSASRRSGTKTAYDALSAACKTDKKRKLITPSILETKVAAFEALLGNQAAKASASGTAASTFGRPHTDGSCNTSSGQGMCINYKMQLETTGGGIPWVNRLVDAANKLRTSAAAQARAHALKTQLQTLQTTTWAIYKQAVSAELNAPNGEHGNYKGLGKQEQCVTKNQTSAQCPKDHCDYDSEKKECKPKTGTETTAAAATGETSNGVDCSKHQTKQACEAENKDVKPGEKAVSGWIDYVDGKGKLDPPECRSFSILVNKKFSQIADAFMSLVFLILEICKDFCLV